MDVEKKKLKIALIQMAVGYDKQKNVEKACQKISEVSKTGADIVVLPEMFNCPYSNEFFRDYAEPQGGETWSVLSDCAKRNNTILIAGSIPELEDDKVYNTSFVFDHTGKQIARHRKVHLFDIDVEGGQQFKESDTFTPGDEITLFPTEFGVVGLCVCFDLRFPELVRLMVLKGAEIVIVPAAFNMTTGPAHWEMIFRLRAVDNQVFTIGVAPARDEKGVYVSYGNSIVCSPWGEILYRAGSEEKNILAEIDLNMNRKIREQLPLLSALRNDIYKLVEK